MESVVASLSASECLGYLQGASLDANALAQLRAVLGDAARQDPSLRARLEALAPAASPPPASPPPPAAAADGGDLAAFLATAGLERFAAPLSAGIEPRRLLAAPASALRTCGTRRQARASSPWAPEQAARRPQDRRVAGRQRRRRPFRQRRRARGGGARAVAPDLAAFLDGLDLGRHGPQLAACGIGSAAALLATPPETLKNLRDPVDNAKVLSIGPLSKIRAALPALEAAAECLSGANLDQYGPALAAAGYGTLARVKAASGDELKALTNPATGGKLLAIGPLSKLRTRGQRRGLRSAAGRAGREPGVAGREPGAGPRGLPRGPRARAARAGLQCGFATVADLARAGALKDLVDPVGGAKVLTIGPSRRSAPRCPAPGCAAADAAPPAARGAATPGRAARTAALLRQLEIDRVAAGLAACGVTSVADVRRLGPDGLKDLR
ncbi:hypothetical protein JL721_7037 [Aureococcus anophagefferens]|nr:hypothetical protein JL721_7037 [Aureococcus anophagefferens]